MTASVRRVIREPFLYLLRTMPMASSAVPGRSDVLIRVRCPATSPEGATAV